MCVCRALFEGRVRGYVLKHRGCVPSSRRMEPWGICWGWYIEHQWPGAADGKFSDYW